ncbi:MAG: SAM-dependent methyltransferase [Acidobacteriota bacterium]
MEPGCCTLIANRIRQQGPITVAEYMDLALYAPDAGYYARAAQRSGRTGDFYTSVDASPLFGELLARQFAEMWRAMAPAGAPPAVPFELVEAGAGNGRLSRDVLDGAQRRDPSFYQSIAVHLSERSAAARLAHAGVYADHPGRFASSSADLPTACSGVLFANELLDAFPVHRVAMTAQGLCEIFVDIEAGQFVERLGEVSSPALATHLERLGITLDVGARAEINLAALAWIRAAASSLTRGFLLLVDYGHEAVELYSPAHADGTLTTFYRHVADAADQRGRGTPAWLAAPGTRDLTSHVDLTSIRREAERSGLITLGVVDQSRFLLNLAEHTGLLAEVAGPDRLRDRLALKTLLLPGGLGSTHRVMVFGKQVGTPALTGMLGRR